MSARTPAASADTPPRVMVVTCPDLHSANLHSANLGPGPDIQTARRHEQVIAAVILAVSAVSPPK
ncbi:MAG TPA: hypothetical protein VE979_16525 [Streptosporangiaceae bacterium]|nr:hypothetical protein [Streptosporangiaceae bacterium]